MISKKYAALVLAATVSLGPLALGIDSASSAPRDRGGWSNKGSGYGGGGGRGTVIRGDRVQRSARAKINGWEVGGCPSYLSRCNARRKGFRGAQWVMLNKMCSRGEGWACNKIGRSQGAP
jgi:hypothetical protein